MTSVKLKDIAQKALATVIASDLTLIVVSFFAYTIVPTEWLDVTIMPSMIFVVSPILFVGTIITTWIYRNYLIWKEIRDEHEHQKEKPITVDEDCMIHYPSGGFERKIR